MQPIQFTKEKSETIFELFPSDLSTLLSTYLRFEDLLSLKETSQFFYRLFWKNRQVIPLSFEKQFGLTPRAPLATEYATLIRPNPRNAFLLKIKVVEQYGAILNSYKKDKGSFDEQIAFMREISLRIKIINKYQTLSKTESVEWGDIRVMVRKNNQRIREQLERCHKFGNISYQPCGFGAPSVRIYFEDNGYAVLRKVDEVIKVTIQTPKTNEKEILQKTLGAIKDTNLKIEVAGQFSDLNPIEDESAPTYDPDWYDKWVDAHPFKKK